ncbi:bifunctional diaminohydroxyphosphoribosylaminopyrimidine deaminase/5-amino-6-(5-phosphoribosylamino)uracil reductase RibD [Eubacterium sp. 1001713B170207_170306_E7]|uniref:bifunctional diaminohydroxyphosphoribosylaminopyrimidine deaminase/5-amino-6-(5-phosphoribosylamino)uracil reductase RibD n=1 Tax=Eubacterium sp. 1001713B170207_170306_E7 TaxID=2787097 RepID=UPI001896EC86|nr:bifunctional diaminohydroxyphosphoribosylaminopyrimidine deaminase/5-amino-6-(5-phosphoribosylamino)uracil reductase RibD [Eubacterium sp. 1001713B170207_170306_E7]
MTDQHYMRLALEQAWKGCGFVNPNPMVGAVLVKNDHVIGRGAHERYGGPHAEQNAIDDCSGNLEGATLYVTLTPCCHFGKTPPCTEAILKSGIKRVVVGAHDPNPLVAEKSIEMLRQHGVEVATDVLRQECDALNAAFFHFIRTRTPYVILKYAMTMDGKIATVSGKSKWITGETARERVHQDRKRYTAIMTGIGTIMADDPLLTCRIPEGRDPVRIVCDTTLRIPLTARVVKTAHRTRTIIATSSDEKKRSRLCEAGCEILMVPAENNRLDLKALMKQLGEMNIDSVLQEGGPRLNSAALESGIVNKVQAYIAPKLFGGQHAQTPVGGNGVDLPRKAWHLSAPVITQLGQDILLESEVLPCLQES